jgi:hypothetical protein
MRSRHDAADAIFCAQKTISMVLSGKLTWSAACCYIGFYLREETSSFTRYFSVALQFECKRMLRDRGLSDDVSFVCEA